MSKKYDITGVNLFVNIFFGWLLFWFYLLFFRGELRVRQAGSVSIFSHFFAFIIVGKVAEAGYFFKNTGHIIALVLNVVLHIFLSHKYRKKYNSRVSSEIWTEMKQMKPHKTGFFRTLGFTVESIVFGFIFFIVGFGVFIYEYFND